MKKDKEIPCGIKLGPSEDLKALEICREIYMENISNYIPFRNMSESFIKDTFRAGFLSGMWWKGKRHGSQNPTIEESLKKNVGPSI